MIHHKNVASKRGEKTEKFELKTVSPTK